MRRTSKALPPPLPEYRRRRQALDERLQALERQRQHVEVQVDQHQAATQVMASIEGFCEQLRKGLAQATFAQRRRLVELLIDRVIVTNGDVEIHYVIPTSPARAHVRFSHLRTNYFDRLPRRQIAGQKTPGTSGAEYVEDGVEDGPQAMASWNGVVDAHDAKAHLGAVTVPVPIRRR